MIDEELRRKIEQKLPDHLIPEELEKEGVTDYDIFFKECYKVVDNGYDMVVLSPWCNKVPSMVFSMDTGEFVGLEDIECAREYGELL